MHHSAACVGRTHHTAVPYMCSVPLHGVPALSPREPRSRTRPPIEWQPVGDRERFRRPRFRAPGCPAEPDRWYACERCRCCVGRCDQPDVGADVCDVPASDEDLVGEGELSPPCRWRPVGTGHDVRRATCRRLPPFTSFRNYTVWLNTVIDIGSVRARQAPRGTSRHMRISRTRRAPARGRAPPGPPRRADRRWHAV